MGSTDVEQFLTSAGLDKYTSKILDYGFNSFSSLQCASIEDLRHKVGMLPGHARLLQRRLGEMNAQIQSRAQQQMQVPERPAPYLIEAPQHEAEQFSGQLAMGANANLQVCIGNWLVENGDVHTIQPGGAMLINGRDAGPDQAIRMNYDGGNASLVRADGWTLLAEGSSPMMLVWTKFGQENVMWMKTTQEIKIAPEALNAPDDNVAVPAGVPVPRVVLPPKSVFGRPAPPIVDKAAIDSARQAAARIKSVIKSGGAMAASNYALEEALRKQKETGQVPGPEDWYDTDGKTGDAPQGENSSHGRRGRSRSRRRDNSRDRSRSRRAASKRSRSRSRGRVAAEKLRNPPRNWICSKCAHKNYAVSLNCYKCASRRRIGLDDIPDELDPTPGQVPTPQPPPPPPQQQPSGGSELPDWLKDLEQPAQQTSIGVLFIPGDLVGPFIGRGGEIINAIRAQSASHIQLEEAYDENGQKVAKITITGDVEKCSKLITERLQTVKEVRNKRGSGKGK